MTNGIILNQNQSATIEIKLHYVLIIANSSLYSNKDKTGKTLLSVDPYDGAAYTADFNFPSALQQ